MNVIYRAGQARWGDDLQAFKLCSLTAAIMRQIRSQPATTAAIAADKTRYTAHQAPIRQAPALLQPHLAAPRPWPPSGQGQSVNQNVLILLTHRPVPN